MVYQVLYRRFRSKTFDEIVGQGEITSILKNQIKTGQISHAYLFCGPKGTGKTSTAKVLAKSVNCENPKDGEACGKCAYCQSLTDNSLSDVIEFDAASNRGIDEIRSLRENIGYLPSVGRYRVYIIDEVHMMTQEAFNALLKTLEEPPRHVIFIFCTTEPNKIPPTILSRCQRFDFKRISEDDIVSWLTHVTGTLKVEADSEALKLIAQNSDGAMRDALSYLDKALGGLLEGEVLTAEKAASAMGLSAAANIYTLAEAICESSPQRALTALDAAAKDGSDLNYLVGQLISYYRDLLVFSVCGEDFLNDIAKNEADSIKRSLLDIQSEMVVNYISTLSKIRHDAKYVMNLRPLLEAAICYLCDKNRVVDVINLTARVERLEATVEQLSSIINSGVYPAQTSAEKTGEKKQAAADNSTEVRTVANPSENYAQAVQKPAPVPTAAAKPPARRADRDLLAKYQDAVIFAGKYIFNKENSILVSDIISQLKVKDYSEGELFVFPTGTAVGMMDVFAAKKGAEKLAQILSQKLSEDIRVTITEPDEKPAPKKTGEELIKDIFGDMAEKVEG